MYIYMYKSTAKLWNINHCDFKVSPSQAKIDETFANYFLKTKLTTCVLWRLNVNV